MTLWQKFKKWYCYQFNIDTRRRVKLPLRQFVFYMNVPREGHINIVQLKNRCNIASHEAMEWTKAIMAVHALGLVNFDFECDGKYYESILAIPQDLIDQNLGGDLLAAYSLRENVRAIWDREAADV